MSRPRRTSSEVHCLLGGLLVVCALGPAGPRREPPPAEKGLCVWISQGAYHVVRPGETWWAVAQRYGCGLTELLRLNGRGSPGVLLAGERVRVPGRKPPEVSVEAE